MSDSLVVVDTSVFIDFFRGRKSEKFQTLVADNRVALSRYVRLELLLGVRRNEVTQVASALTGLIQLIPQPRTFEQAERILERLRMSGLTIGTVDILIAAEAQIHGYAIMSHDKVFAKIAALKLIEVI